MSCNRRANRRKRNSRSKPRTVQNVQKASGVIGHRVKHVDGEKFAIVSVDPAKNRSEWMMADYFGNLLIEPQTLEHQAAFFKLAVVQIREAQQQHLRAKRDLRTNTGQVDLERFPMLGQVAPGDYSASSLLPVCSKRSKDPCGPRFGGLRGAPHGALFSTRGAIYGVILAAALWSSLPRSARKTRRMGGRFRGRS